MLKALQNLVGESSDRVENTVWYLEHVFSMLLIQVVNHEGSLLGWIDDRSVSSEFRIYSRDFFKQNILSFQVEDEDFFFPSPEL